MPVQRESNLGRFVFWLYLCLLPYAVFSTFYLSTVLVFELPVLITVSLCLIATLSAGAVVYLLRNPLVGVLDTVAGWLARIPTKRWLAGIVVLGWMFRAAWIYLYEPIQRSDEKTYFKLAARLADTGEYFTSGTHAYWPPGMPFSLLPGMALFGPTWFVPALNNCLFYALTLIVVHFLAKRIAGARVSRLATLLVAIWPNYIFYSGLAAKEMLVALLIPLALLSYVTAAESSGSRQTVLLGFLSGLVAGFAALTQPSWLLIGSVFLCFEVMRRSTVRSAANRLVPLIAGMILVVSPWTIRNYIVLDAFVPVSNTGGVSLYVGNNPSATGGYVKPSGFDTYDEVTANRLMGEAARRWIKENPGRFLALAVKKQILLFGGDAGGAYGTLKRGLGIEGKEYVGLKGLSNAFWLMILCLGTLALWRCRQTNLASTPLLATMMLFFFYILTIHSVFESGSRHHVFLLGFLAIIAALIVHRPSETNP